MPDKEKIVYWSKEDHETEVKKTELLEWLKRDFETKLLRPTDEAIAELVAEVERLVRILTKQERLRPSLFSREMAAFAGNLQKVARQAERIGDRGLRTIVAALGVGTRSSPTR